MLHLYLYNIDNNGTRDGVHGTAQVVSPATRPSTRTARPSGKTHKTVTRQRSDMSTTIRVRGMSCEGCEETVREALEDVDGVIGARADSEKNLATAEGDPDPDELVAAVEDAGYEAST